MTTIEHSSLLESKHDRLLEIIGAYKKVIIAYSGGVDSVFLLKVALDALGPDRVLACIGLSASLARTEYKGACDIAKDLGAKVEIVHPEEMNNPDYLANPANRCYFCKSELFKVLCDVAKTRQFDAIFTGTNADDMSDFRPGLQAAKEFDVIGPLAKAGLTKEDIRIQSKKFNLPTWDKPAQPCLSSRVTYGLSITPERLKQIEKGEEFLRSKGLKELRVRHHDNLVRIEVPPDKFNTIMQPDMHRQIVTFFKSLGFTYVTLDLQGFRSGSGNELLQL